MLIRLYSIYDRVARVYADPFVSVNDATAARAFTLAQSSPDTMLYASPGDYQLWFVGSLDNTTGNLITHDDDDVRWPYKVSDGQPREVSSHEQ